MQICWQRIAFRETDHELLWLSVSLMSLAAAAAWFALRLPWPQCVFHSLTGHPCITCGATRAAIAFFHGNFFAAWELNPLAFVSLCAVTVFDVYAFVVVTTRARRLRLAQMSGREKSFVRALVVIALASNWTYLLIANPSL